MNPNTYGVDEASKSQTKLWFLASGLVVFLIAYHLYGVAEIAPEKEVVATEVAYSDASEAKRESNEILTVQWPEIQIEDLVKHNPFKALQTSPGVDQADDFSQAGSESVQAALPRLLEQRRQEHRAMKSELAGSQWKIRMVLQREGQDYAMIGENLVTVGDELNGYRILEIQSDGVVLEPLTQEQSP